MCSKLHSILCCLSTCNLNLLTSFDICWKYVNIPYNFSTHWTCIKLLMNTLPSDYTISYTITVPFKYTAYYCYNFVRSTKNFRLRTIPPQPDFPGNWKPSLQSIWTEEVWSIIFIDRWRKTEGNKIFTDVCFVSQKIIWTINFYEVFFAILKSVVRR